MLVDQSIRAPHAPSTLTEALRARCCAGATMHQPAQAGQEVTDELASGSSLPGVALVRLQKRDTRAGAGKIAGMNLSDKLKSLGVTLPPVSGPFGAYIPAKRVGNLLYVAGQLP